MRGWIYGRQIYTKTDTFTAAPDRHTGAGADDEVSGRVVGCIL